jgi:hypothetical protein
MSRINLSEIHEHAWFPESLRDGVTDALQFILSASYIYQPIASDLSRAINAAGANHLLDLCSGSGGPWTWLHRTLALQSPSRLEICLTDKYPNIAAFKRAHSISRGAISYCAESIDAARIPTGLRGFRTIFTSFHHFPPDQAAAILQNAVDNQQGIGIFEAPRRRPLCVLLTFLMPLAALLMVPFIRPFRFSLIFWTYVIPVIPFVLWFDGVLSCLRAYSLAELSQLILRLRPNHYKWEVGEKFGWLSPVTYLLGYPVQKNSQLGLSGHNVHEEANT